MLIKEITPDPIIRELEIKENESSRSIYSLYDYYQKITDDFRIPLRTLYSPEDIQILFESSQDIVNDYLRLGEYDNQAYKVIEYLINYIAGR